jgi:uncharacterized OsmC-like protein
LRTVTVRGFRLSSGDGADVAGFDLGPSPEEHLLAAVGSSLAQTIAHVACAHDLSIDRVDIDLIGHLVTDSELARIAGRLSGIEASVTLATTDSRDEFQPLRDEVLRQSPLAAVISIPVRMTLHIEPVEPGTGADDWQI